MAPGNRGDALFLRPSLRYCVQELECHPGLVVGDTAYINLAVQREIRERWDIGLITRLRPDMHLVKPFEPPGLVAGCRQGQRLEWLGYETRDRLQWFGAVAPDALCTFCWEKSQCPRQFGYPAESHEILFGRFPLASEVAQRLLNRVRPWIEPSQSYEKNQLGLGVMFLNSLRLTWTMGLLADTVVLLRTYPLVRRPEAPRLLQEMLPAQLELGMDPVF